MELKNIFKMELFKNRNDAPYLKVIAILTAMAAATSIWGVSILNSDFGPMDIMIIPLAVFTFLGLFIFSLLYPFHLLNVDYKNKVISLIFASGVSREKYYFVKISATILSSLIAIFVILFIPIVVFLIVYPDIFVELIQYTIKNFTSPDIFPFVLSATISLVANTIILTTAVIITKGKTSGIFLYIVFGFIVSMIQTSILIPLFQKTILDIFYLDIIISIFKIVIFVLIGLHVLRRQDL